MDNYKGIKGYKVQSLASDPTSVAGDVVQVWYNTSGNALKYLQQAAGAWASGGALTTGRNTLGGAGTQNAGLVFGGLIPGSSALTETYNGTAWTEVADRGTARYFAGSAGTQTAALYFGGRPDPTAGVSEEWDGTSWAEGSNLNTARYALSGFGTQTAAVGAGGYRITPATSVGNVEEYNGTCWSEETDILTVVKDVGGFGTQTAGAIVGGRRISPEAAWNGTQEYDGSCWAAGGNLNTGSFANGIAGITQTTGLIFARKTVGPPGIVISPKTEEYDGTTWTEVADMATTRSGASTQAGTGPAAIAAGGGPPTVNTVEEWSGAPLTVKTVTVS